jgi:MFS transporter, DHA1 family, tetracycline resistance protein
LGENQGNKDMKHIFDFQLRESIHLFPLLVVNFIGTLGFSIVLPFIVFLVNKLGDNSFIYGLANSIYPAF